MEHDIAINRLPAMTLAVFDHLGDFSAIGARYDQPGAWAAARGLIGAATRFIALYPDNPKTVPETALRSMAGITVAAGNAMSDGVRLMELPEMRIVALRFRKPYAELEGTYDWLYGAWLAAGGEAPADLPIMEEYLNDCRALPPAEWLTEVMMPLR